MTTKQIFSILVNDINTTVIATTDKNGLPVTCAIDIMDYDENGLYFLTAKGKQFYRRLKANCYLSLTGLKGESTMSCLAVSICGKVKEIGFEHLQRLLDKNPYMYEIYPTKQSRSALTVFCLYEGQGEWFDLSKKPIERFSFSFGGGRKKTDGYFITDDCIGCGNCLSVCPQSCIVLNEQKASITQENCLHCGNCINICPIKAVVIK